MKQIFNKLKNFNETLFACLILIVVFVGAGFYKPTTQTALISPVTTSTQPIPGAWLNNLEDKVYESEYQYRCFKGVSEQLKYLDNEILSDKFTFEKYIVANILKTEPKDLDASSSRYANAFRTSIRDTLKETGINFAGHYSIISGAGMTGWSSNYYIIDRANGRAYIFPYSSDLLDFKLDSNLIIMNSKPAILERLKDSKFMEMYCDGRPSWNINDIDARPFYFLWKNNELKLLGPTNIKPPKNEFWNVYFN